MGKFIVFALTTSVFFIATLWVYAGVKHRQVGRFAVIVGLVYLASAALVSSVAWSYGGSTNYRLTGIMGVGTGILLGGVCILFLRQSSNSE